MCSHSHPVCPCRGDPAASDLKLRLQQDLGAPARSHFNAPAAGWTPTPWCRFVHSDHPAPRRVPSCNETKRIQRRTLLQATGERSGPPRPGCGCGDGQKVSRDVRGSTRKTVRGLASSAGPNISGDALSPPALPFYARTFICNFASYPSRVGWCPTFHSYFWEPDSTFRSTTSATTLDSLEQGSLECLACINCGCATRFFAVHCD
jgi:hypothetical protein